MLSRIFSFRTFVHIALLMGSLAMFSPGNAGWPKELLHQIGQFTTTGGASAVSVPSEGRTEIAFSPNEGAEQLVVKVIDSAKTEIRMLTYSFTSKPVAQALLRARKRGVDVEMVVDHKNNLEEDNRTRATPLLNALVNAGIKVRSISAYAIHHDKVIIVDGKTVQTGSMNYTPSGESRNSENVIVLWDSPQAAQAFLTHFNRNFKRAMVYAQRY